MGTLKYFEYKYRNRTRTWQIRKHSLRIHPTFISLYTYIYIYIYIPISILRSCTPDEYLFFFRSSWSGWFWWIHQNIKSCILIRNYRNIYLGTKMFRVKRPTNISQKTKIQSSLYTFNILLKKKLLQFTVHSYLRDYNPIDKEHLSFETGMPTSQCKRRKKEWQKYSVRLMDKEIKGANYHNTWDKKKK